MTRQSVGPGELVTAITAVAFFPAANRAGDLLTFSGEKNSVTTCLTFVTIPFANAMLVLSWCGRRRRGVLAAHGACKPAASESPRWSRPSGWSRHFMPT